MEICIDVCIESIVFENDKNFKICRVKLLNSNDYPLNVDSFFAIKGTFINAIVGQTYQIIGEEIKDPKFGWQVNVFQAKHIIVENKDVVVKYLSSNLFTKIGKVTAQKIVDSLGVSVIKLIEQNPKIIDEELKFLSKIQRKILREGILQNVYIEKIFTFFENIISIEQATNIFLKYGIDGLKKYQENPYLLYFEFDKIHLINIDKFALKHNLVDYNSQFRLEAYIFYFLKTLSSHTFMNIKELKQKLNYQKISDLHFFEQSLITLESKKLIKVIGEDVCYYVNYIYELNIAKRLKTLNQSIDVLDNVEQEILTLEILENISYTKKQKLAIKNVFNNKISIITGGPGTGKTTIINAICKIYDKKNPSYKLALVAPTGKAATKMKESTKKKSATIHSFLGIGINDLLPKYNAFNTLEEDVIILDEASMVDIETFSKLLDGIKNTATLIIVGDVNQLSSVGPGQILYDMIESKLFEVTRLDVIKRQFENSRIINLAQDVLENKISKKFFKEKSNDFEYYQISDLQTSNALLAILEKEKKEFNFDDIQIISPRRKTNHQNINSTVNNINKFVQPIFNDSKTYLFTNFNQKFYLNDRIINNENMHEKDVTNGDQGFLRFPIYEKKNLKQIGIEFNLVVDFDLEELKQIDLAYATTVHKSQGSEYDLVILFLLPEHGTIVTQKLIYTAITRAKKKLIILGNYDYIIKSVANTKYEQRNTKLIEYLGD